MHGAPFPLPVWSFCWKKGIFLCIFQICVLVQFLTCVPRQAKQSLSNSDIPFTFVLLSASTSRSIHDLKNKQILFVFAKMKYVNTNFQANHFSYLFSCKAGFHRIHSPHSTVHKSKRLVTHISNCNITMNILLMKSNLYYDNLRRQKDVVKEGHQCIFAESMGGK